MKEEVYKFGPTGEMVGVLCSPAEAALAPIVVLPNAGLIHRIGPNRLHVQIARSLARLGITTLRFDFKGIGDSQNLEHAGNGGDLVAGTVQAMDFLARSTGADRFVFVGICSGAIASYHAAKQDSRIVGLGLLNPLGGNLVEAVAPLVAIETRRRYYAESAWRNTDSWRRFLGGKSDYAAFAKALLGTVKDTVSPPVAPDSLRMLTDDCHRLLNRGVRMLLVHSERGQEAEMMRHLELQRAGSHFTTHVIANSDHSFTPLRCQQELLEIIHAWMEPFRSNHERASGAARRLSAEVLNAPEGAQGPPSTD
jgi:alpha/beta superfamily hydrolase